MRLAICLNWNEPMLKSKIDEVLYNGLDDRIRLEMVRLNAQSIQSM